MDKKEEHHSLYEMESDAIREAKIRNWRMWGSWFSWGSPVGLGLFIIAVGIFIVLLRVQL